MHSVGMHVYFLAKVVSVMGCMIRVFPIHLQDVR